MKAAPERPFSPVFCLHGPLQKSVWRGDIWKPGPLASAWQGEPRLTPQKTLPLVHISALKEFHFVPDQTILRYV